MHIDQITKTRRKTIALIVRKDGSLLVRAPMWVNRRQIEEFVREKSDWIKQKKAEMLQRSLQVHPRRYQEGEKFLYLGREIELEIIDRQDKKLILDRSFKLLGSALPRAEQVLTQWYRQNAGEVISSRVKDYATRYGFKPARVGITNARTRWGSCSHKGSLNFSWRLVMASLDVIDYVVVHELVHLRHPNHSKVFWKGVAEILPDYPERRTWLKTNGHLLTLEEFSAS